MNRAARGFALAPGQCRSSCSCREIAPDGGRGNMKRAIIETWVGLFVLCGIGAVAMLAFQVGNTSLFGPDDGYRIYARFDDIGGLAVKAPVSIAGVNVGRVTSIAIDQQTYQAVVELSISDTGVSIPEDSSAMILTAGLLGAQYVGLSPGAEDVYLEDGSEIELTQSSFSIEGLIGEFLYRSTTSEN